MLCHLKEVQEILGHILVMWLWISNTDPLWLGITFVGGKITKIHATCCLSALGTQPVLIKWWFSPPHPSSSSWTANYRETWGDGHAMTRRGWNMSWGQWCSTAGPETGMVRSPWDRLETGKWWYLVQVRFWLFFPDSQSCTHNWLISDILTASPKCRVFRHAKDTSSGVIPAEPGKSGGCSYQLALFVYTKTD